MSLERQQDIFKFLDSNIGEDCCFEDYDDKESLLEYAIELVEGEEDLTQSCGVGPIVHHIKAWIDLFEKKTHYDNLNTQLEIKDQASNRHKI